MATSPLPVNFLSFDSPQSSSVSLYLFNSQHGFHSLISSRIVRVRRISCSSQTIEKVGTPETIFYKKKRKPKPSFLDKIQEKWSVKTTSLREKLPWQEEEGGDKEETPEHGLQFTGVEQLDSESDVDSGLSKPVVGFNSLKRGHLPPWVQEKKKPQFGSEIRKLDKKNGRNAAIAGVQHSKEVAERLDFDDEKGLDDVKDDGIPVGFSSFKRGTIPPWVQKNKPTKPQFGSEIRNLDKSNERDAVISGVQHSKKIAGRSDFDDENGLDDAVGFSSFKRGIFPPWVQGNKPTKPQFGSEIRNLGKSNDRDAANAGVQHSKKFGERLDFDDENGLDDVRTEGIPVGLSSFKKGTFPPWVQANKPTKLQFGSEMRNLDKSNEWYPAIAGVQHSKENAERLDFDDKKGQDDIRNERTPVELSQEIQSLMIENKDEVGEFKRHEMDIPHEFSNVSSSSARLPWEGEKNSEREYIERKSMKKTHVDLAEKLVPEPELKRLRNAAKRMVERIKVGEAGVTLPLVDSIQKKWKVDEVVKLKFEGPPSNNMGRTHEILESRTGGLVIWRSGSSIALYRGMGYKLDCIKSYINQSQYNAKTRDSPEASDVDIDRSTKTDGSAMAADLSSPGSSKYSNNLSVEELKDLQELNLVLDGLGPRYESWSGREPLPVDADLLPARVHGYTTPLRRLPYGTRQSLRDKEMTYLRQTARQVPPHFALGRNRELQGLASAMVKLWEKSAIAKIAIKRGVQNTSNERMAEELKVLTGGTLISRNKEYIVFYRGNDFLPRGISEAVKETEKVSDLRQDEEERARQKAAALIDSIVKLPKQPLVAGTLAETKAATKRWSNQPSSEELEKMMKDSAVERHAALVKFLENKLAIAKGKITLAEKALGKMHEKMQSADLPTDLETLTDEERFLFRKIGLSMKTYLPLGRREVFDGTIENMHLHWKYKELVKVIVKDGKNLPQVKHIAISLEAESGGVLVSVEKTSKGYAIIVYRGKNYQRPITFRPKTLLTKKEALSRATELQRREALKYHVLELQEKIKNLKSELEHMKLVKEIDEETLHSRIDGASDDDDDGDDDDDDFEEDEGNETDVDISDSEDEDGHS